MEPDKHNGCQSSLELFRSERLKHLRVIKESKGWRWGWRGGCFHRSDTPEPFYHTAYKLAGHQGVDTILQIEGVNRTGLEHRLMRP